MRGFREDMTLCPWCCFVASDAPLDVGKLLRCPRRPHDVPPPVEALAPMSVDRLPMPIKMSEDSDPMSVFRNADGEVEPTEEKSALANDAEVRGEPVH